MPRGCAPKMIPKGPDTLPTMVNASFRMEISSGLLPSCIGKADKSHQFHGRPCELNGQKDKVLSRRVF